MSRKPTIIIRYPEASSKALQLTEAMVKCAPGKRVVETESEDPIFPDGGELFSSFIRCKTQTGVELTLTLNRSSMDYALETLIRPNLTADERKEILGEDVEPEQAELPISAQAAEAPGQALDGGSSSDMPSDEREAETQSGEQEKQIEIGKISEKELRDIINDMLDDMEKGFGTFDAIGSAIYKIKEATQSSEIIPTHQLYEVDLRRIISTAMDDWKAGRGDCFGILNTAILDIKKLAGEIRMQESELEAAQDFDMTAQLALTLALTSHLKHKKMRDQLKKVTDELILDLGDTGYISTKELRNAYLITVQKDLELEDKEPDEIVSDILAEDWSKGELIDEEPSQEPSWDDVEKEAQTIGQHADSQADDAELKLGEETKGVEE